MEHVSIQREGAILNIRLNRPDKKNALTSAMYAALADAVEAAETDLSVGVILFSGVGGAFTAGNDLKDFQQNPPRGDEAPVFRFILSLARSTVPMVAAVEGVAVGIGTTCLLHCDLVYASEDARLQMPFINLGLVPEAGSTYLLPKLMGYAQAAELLMLGRPINAERALALGLVNQICSKETVMETALAAAREICEKPPAAVRTTKSLLKADRGVVEATIRKESAEFTACLRSEECAEALTAFMEKRKPDFSRFRQGPQT